MYSVNKLDSSDEEKYWFFSYNSNFNPHKQVTLTRSSFLILMR